MDIKVYIKINENNEIIQIESSIFLEDTTDYIEIDSGSSDKYSHAQTQYLEKNLIDEFGRYNYKYIDGTVVEISEEEKEDIVTEQQITTEERLNALEAAMLEMILGGAE